MTESTATLVQGTLDMLILKTLALEPLHGVGDFTTDSAIEPWGV